MKVLYPRARLRLSGEAYLRFGLEQTEFYRTIFMGERDEVGPPKDFSTSATFRFLVDRVAECIEAEFLRPESAEDIALTIWAHTHGLVSLYIAGALPMTDEEFQRAYDRSLRYLIEGIRA